MRFRPPISFKATTIGLGVVLVATAAAGAYYATVGASTEQLSAPKKSPIQSWTFAKAAAKPQKLAGIHPKPVPVGKPADTSGAAHNNPALISVVVNKKHPMQPLDYTPPLSTLSCGGTVAYLNPQAAASFNALCNAANAAGMTFRITSSFRSYQNQVDTYNQWVAVNGSAAAADTVSARPGYSEHQTGLAMDIATGSCALECFAGTPQYAWMQAHAAEYGFIQRYYAGYESITGYSPEPWHYRYVGTAVAQDMKARGIKTLEQYWGVSGGDYAN